MSKTIITPATAITTSGVIRVLKSNERIPCNLISTGLAGAETITLQVSHDGGTTFNDVYKSGSKQVLSATNTVVTITSPGYYRFYKVLTAAAAGLYLTYEGEV